MTDRVFAWIPVTSGIFLEDLSSKLETVRGNILSISVKLVQETARPQTLNWKLFDFPTLTDYLETSSTKLTSGNHQRACLWMLLFFRKAVLFSVAFLVCSLPVCVSARCLSVCQLQLRPQGEVGQVFGSVGLERTGSDISCVSLVPCGKLWCGLVEFSCEL